jgi:phosphate starvation-inducible PhoH-like protein
MDRISRAEKRSLRKQKRGDEKNIVVNGLKIKNIKPKTQNQELVFKDFTNGKNLLIHGLPGTGKSFISLYLALSEIENFRNYHKVVVIRSVVPSRDMGFLPGSIKEKSKVYEQPYYEICKELYGRGDAYDILKNKNIIEFQTSSFLRGLTLDNSIIIVDECQNMTYSELSTIITRTGQNSKIIFCGDYRQTDLKYDDEKQGIFYFMRILKNMHKHFSCIEFMEDDIVRSGLVKEFILTKSRYDTNVYNMVQMHGESQFKKEQNLSTH